jgi:hypothetical protein
MSLVKRCSGITRLRMKGVQGLAPEDAFKLAPLLPALTHYQIPTGTNAHQPDVVVSHNHNHQ